MASLEQHDDAPTVVVHGLSAAHSTWWTVLRKAVSTSTLLPVRSLDVKRSPVRLQTASSLPPDETAIAALKISVRIM